MTRIVEFMEHCEACGREMGIPTGQDFTYRLATWNRAQQLFVVLPSKRFTVVEDGQSTPDSLRVCSVPCGRKLCQPGQYIILIDEGDLVNPRAAFDHTGSEVKKFW